MRRWFVGLCGGPVARAARLGGPVEPERRAGRSRPRSTRRGEGHGRRPRHRGRRRQPVAGAARGSGLLVRAPSNGPTRPTSQHDDYRCRGPIRVHCRTAGIDHAAGEQGRLLQPGRRRCRLRNGAAAAEPRSIAAGQTLDGQTIRLLRGGAIVGRIVDEFGEPVEGVDVECAAPRAHAGGPALDACRPRPWGGASTTDDTGRSGCGTCHLVVTWSRRNRPVPGYVPRGTDTVRQGFAPTYFPGTARLADAGLVTVIAGRDTSAVSFALATAPLATVRGTVLTVDGQRPGDVSLSVSRIDTDRLDSSSSGAKWPTTAVSRWRG